MRQWVIHYSVVYYGLMFSKEKVSPDPCQVQAVKAAGRPRNAVELNSFICTFRYSARFLEARKYQRLVCKLGELLKGKFVWKDGHTEAFEELKTVLSSDTVQASLDLQSDHELLLDGCPMGLAATLTQRGQGIQSHSKPNHWSQSKEAHVWAGATWKILRSQQTSQASRRQHGSQSDFFFHIVCTVCRRPDILFVPLGEAITSRNTISYPFCPP